MSPHSPVPLLDSDIVLGHRARTIALIGDDGGRYPYGNSLLVLGSEAGVLIDPSLSVAKRAGVPGRVDRVLVSHAHEDHVAGVHRFPTASVHAHHEDLPGVQSLDGIMAVYGLPPAEDAIWRPQVVEQFYFHAREDATGFGDGDRFDLGGAAVTVVHLPGHTRGHSGFFVEPDGVFFVADIDLSTFGPYYGDHWSNLDDFEKAIARCREIDARWYATFHHKGVVEGRGAFLDALDAFAAIINRRERALVEFLAELRTIDDVVEHRFIYRKSVELVWADHVERRSMTMHLERLLTSGEVVEIEPGLYRAA